jgi:hypothetical protein
MKNILEEIENQLKIDQIELTEKMNQQTEESEIDWLENPSELSKEWEQGIEGFEFEDDISSHKDMLCNNGDFEELQLILLIEYVSDYMKMFDIKAYPGFILERVYYFPKALDFLRKISSTFLKK